MLLVCYPFFRFVAFSEKNCLPQRYIPPEHPIRYLLMHFNDEDRIWSKIYCFFGIFQNVFASSYFWERRSRSSDICLWNALTPNLWYFSPIKMWQSAKFVASLLLIISIVFKLVALAILEKNVKILYNIWLLLDGNAR